MNVILLWATCVERGFASDRWMTYRQARELGGHVRKGERGETVVYADRFIRSEIDPDTGEEIEHAIPFMKTYTVFNVEQIDGLPERFYTWPEPINPGIERDAALEAFFGATGTDIRHGGARAYYALESDYVQMPPIECFRDCESYYATLAHEMTHWTRHPSRLNRDFGRKHYGDEGYAREELVAEIGAALLCAELGITPEIREDHAAYIDSWLVVLKHDKRAIFSAAAHAPRAIEYLYFCQKRDAYTA